MTERKPLHPLLKLALELGPLLIFFFANSRPALFAPWVGPLLPAAVASGERANIFVATAAFMIAILVSLAVSYALTRRLPLMALISAVVVVVFGALTLMFQDELFIKLKPTIIYLMFAGVLGLGLWLKRNFLAVAFDQMFNLTDEGWRKLTIRWALFFVAMAVLNELVWRNTSTDTWVSFKVFAVLPLTFVFAMAQVPLLNRHDAAKDAEPADNAPSS